MRHATRSTDRPRHDSPTNIPGFTKQPFLVGHPRTLGDLPFAVDAASTNTFTSNPAGHTKCLTASARSCETVYVLGGQDLL